MRVSPVIRNDSLNRGIQIESNGKPNAKASTSSATGLAQFIAQTWLATIYQHGPLSLAKQIKKGANGKYTVPNGNERAILDMRKAGNNPALLKLNIDLMARLWEDNAKAFGPGWNDGDLYLGHFAGVGAARKLLRADQSATAVSVVGQAAANANPTIFYVYSKNKRGRAKTVAELRAWSKSKMETTWEKAGKPDWIAKYYPANVSEVEEPEPAPIETHEDRPPVKLEPVFIDEDSDGFDDKTGLPMPGSTPIGPSEPSDEPEEPDEGDDKDRSPVEPPPRPLPPGITMKGDPATWLIQHRLRLANYDPGLLDGKYGGKTAAAIAGFLTDWPKRFASDIPFPKSAEEFEEIKDDLGRELEAAEKIKFKRPVTKERAEAKPEVVNEVAPEIIPAKRNRFMAWLAGIGTLVGGSLKSFKETVGEYWNWFTDHRDDLPDNGQGLISGAWDWVSGLPPMVWFVLAGVGLIAFAVNSHLAVKKIENDVKAGLR